MQREISNRNTLGDTLNPIDDIRRSTAIDRTTSNYNDAKEEKVPKICDLVKIGNSIHRKLPCKSSRHPYLFSY